MTKRTVVEKLLDSINTPRVHDVDDANDDEPLDFGVAHKSAVVGVFGWLTRT